MVKGEVVREKGHGVLNNDVINLGFITGILRIFDYYLQGLLQDHFTGSLSIQRHKKLYRSS